jgi:CHAD domain-containing protein
MAAELEGKKAATKEARKILLRQIDKAGAPLKAKQASDSKVHRARKQIKMARATLRLLRKGLARKRYRAENERLRDAAKPLSEGRDATVLLTTFAELVEGQERDQRGIQDFHDELTRERGRIRRKLAGDDGLARSRRLLHRARAHAAQWHVGSKGWSVVGAGLGKVYGQGRDALEAVRNTPTDSALHEWRKQAKYLRHQLQLLWPIRPATIAGMVDDLHELTDHPGDDHDLAVLRVWMAAQPAQFANVAAQRRLNIRINRRRMSLQREALDLGSRIYQETPPQFCFRLRGYWRDWRSGPAADDAEKHAAVR